MSWDLDPETGLAAALAWLASQRLAGERLIVHQVATPALVSLILAAPLADCQLILLPERRSAEELRNELPLATARWSAELNLPEVFAAEASDSACLLAWRRQLPEWQGLCTFTSGSTGRPRPVRLDGGLLAIAAAAQARALQLRDGERWACCLPLDHSGGFMPVLRAAISGSSLRLHRRFESAAVAAGLPGCSGISLVPTMLTRLLALPQADWSQLRCVLVGGDALDEPLRSRAVAAGLPLLTTWGMSETGGMVSLSEPGRAGGAGRLLPDYSLLIDDPDADGIGELSVQLPPLADGRLAVLVASGDRGRLAFDGSIELHGRSADRIICGGENLSAQAIARRLQAHPRVQQALVWGEADPDWGTVPVAWIRSDLSAAAMQTWIDQQVPSFQRPRRFLLEATPAPQLSRGKLDRQELRRRLQAQQTAQA